mmetsp:Transcript_5077/g.14596  ORF Transcript_5077/g.14596 Transcript_5077/m.14596 type:complete len:245 (-) Transcript_5077:602-1336(-)
MFRLSGFLEEVGERKAVLCEGAGDPTSESKSLQSAASVPHIEGAGVACCGGGMVPWLSLWVAKDASEPTGAKVGAAAAAAAAEYVEVRRTSVSARRRRRSAFSSRCFSASSSALRRRSFRSTFSASTSRIRPSRWSTSASTFVCVGRIFTGLTEDETWIGTTCSRQLTRFSEVRSGVERAVVNEALSSISEMHVNSGVVGSAAGSLCCGIRLELASSAFARATKSLSPPPESRPGVEATVFAEA